MSPGTYSISLNASDGLNHNLIELNITVLPGAPPLWNVTIEDQTLEPGESLNYAIGAFDISGIDTFWDNSSLFAFDEQGVLANITALESGTHWVELGVNDTLGHTATETLKITVKEATKPQDEGSDRQPVDPTMIFLIIFYILLL